MLYFTGNYKQDLMLMTTLLDTIEYYSGSDRREMLTKNGVKHPPKGSGSMLYGYTWKGYLSPNKSRTKIGEGVYQTKIKDKHPELEKYFREFASLHFPHFEFGQVQMNKNFPCPPHRDSSNIGESILVTCGDYKGGLTVVDFESKLRKYDGKIGPVKFNGSKYLHWVEPFKGTRYALVFFHNRSSRKLLIQ